MSVPHADLRRLLGQRVAVETDRGAVTGTLVSASPRSLWVLCGDQDVLVPLAEVRRVLAGAA
jgi:hypothetical protein